MLPVLNENPVVANQQTQPPNPDLFQTLQISPTYILCLITSCNKLHSISCNKITKPTSAHHEYCFTVQPINGFFENLFFPLNNPVSRVTYFQCMSIRSCKKKGFNVLCSFFGGPSENCSCGFPIIDFDQNSLF